MYTALSSSASGYTSETTMKSSRPAPSTCPFDQRLLASLSNAELISFSNASAFRRPFPPLQFLRTLYLGTFGWLEDTDPASVDQPELPKWCANLATLKALLAGLTGGPILKHSLTTWTSEKLPQLEEIGVWSVDWGKSNPRTDVQREFMSWALYLRIGVRRQERQTIYRMSPSSSTLNYPLLGRVPPTFSLDPSSHLVQQRSRRYRSHASFTPPSRLSKHPHFGNRSTHFIPSPSLALILTELTSLPFPLLSLSFGALSHLARQRPLRYPSHAPLLYCNSSYALDVMPPFVTFLALLSSRREWTLDAVCYASPTLSSISRACPSTSTLRFLPISSMSTIASRPRLPAEVWLEILQQSSSLGYYDLRRLRRVCRGLNDLLQDPSFRDRLFLQPSKLIEPRHLEYQYEVALHPLLHLIECFPEQTTEDLFVRAPPPRSLRTQALTSLEARDDMVTSPAVTHLQLHFQPDEESRSAFSVINVSNPKGVSVLDVYEGIVRLHQDLDAETFTDIFDVACEEGKDPGGYDVYKLFTEWSVERMIDGGELALLIPVLMPPRRELVRSACLLDPALLATADDRCLTSAGTGSTKGSYVESERVSV